MAFLKGLAKLVGIGLLTLVFWVGFNWVRASWQAHVQREQSIDAVFMIVDYNLKAGHLVVPQQEPLKSTPVPAPKAP